MYTFYSSVCRMLKPYNSRSRDSSKEFKESKSKSNSSSRKSSHESLPDVLHLSNAYKTIIALDEQGEKIILEVEVFDPLFARYR